ncbi:unnamed protein product [Cylindrotheca closterium]|uniref:Uncharacterized protein n=1 Tax=Cylindrotheca closterium TaxID=2856 RepID=A0AAD2G7V5_9STRA|nr:unnamed protein product [Cylindrotheca closterium]
MPSSKAKQYESPLTMAASSTNEEITDEKKKKRRELKSRKRARKEAEEDLEAEKLTAMLFGGNASLGASRLFAVEEEAAINDYHGQHQGDGEDLGFQIDRTGLDGGVVEESPLEQQLRGASALQAFQTKDDNAEEESPAWVDDEDEAELSLVESSNRLRKLRHSREETEAITADELEQRLRKRYEESTQKSARIDWANPSHVEEVEDPIAKFFSTAGTLLKSTRDRLPPNILKIVRCPDANQADYNQSVVRAVNFHPGSDPEKPLLLTAGLDKTLRFFQVGAEKSEKIHGVHFPRLPIYNANFLGSSGNVVVSGRRPFFYIYDAVAGKVDLVPRIQGRDEKSWESHVVSPDGKLIAFVGNDGYIVLVDSHNKHWVGDMKCNGSVRALSFTPDGRYILASGSDGDIYRWDVHSRRCVERFSNNDGTVSASIAATSKFMAVGAESGVVNFYSEQQGMSSSKTPLKSIMNLKTSAEDLKFNHDGQIMAMITKREKHGLKLLHVPTQTVFSNWPTSKTPLKYVWSVDFSPKSKYIAIGNDKGKCLLYQLGHYHET